MAQFEDGDDQDMIFLQSVGVQQKLPLADQRIRNDVSASFILPIPGQDTLVMMHAGEVMGSPRVFAVFWGDTWGDGNGVNDRARQKYEYLSKLCDSSYMNFLDQYSVGRPQLIGSAFVQHIAPPEAVTVSQMITYLRAWLDSGRSRRNLRLTKPTCCMLFSLQSQYCSSMTITSRTSAPIIRGISTASFRWASTTYSLRQSRPPHKTRRYLTS